MYCRLTEETKVMGGLRASFASVCSSFNAATATFALNRGLRLVRNLLICLPPMPA